MIICTLSAENVDCGSNNDDANDNALLFDYESEDVNHRANSDLENDDIMATISEDVCKMLYRQSDGSLELKIGMFFLNMKGFTAARKGYAIRGGLGHGSINSSGKE